MWVIGNSILLVFCLLWPFISKSFFCFPFFLFLFLHLSFPPCLRLCFLLFISLSLHIFFLLFLMNLCLCKICPNIYKRKRWVVKLNSEKMLHMLKKCIQHGFQMFPHAFLSCVSSVGAWYFIALFRQNLHWKDSEIQAGGCSSGAVILEWFHLILAMGDWLKSLNNQWDWVTGLCNGPVPGQGLSSLVTKLGQTGIAVRQSRSSLQLCHLQKKKNIISQDALRDPWRSQDKSQVLLRQKKNNPQPMIKMPWSHFPKKSLMLTLMSSCPHVLGHVLAEELGTL